MQQYTLRLECCKLTKMVNFQTPAPNQPFPLPIERQKSSIPKVEQLKLWNLLVRGVFFRQELRRHGCIPANRCFSMLSCGKVDHWTLGSVTWDHLVLSIQGWEFEEGSLAPEDMDHIIKIHNANNESAWQEVAFILTTSVVISPFLLKRTRRLHLTHHRVQTTRQRVAKALSTLFKVESVQLLILKENLRYTGPVLTTY